MSNSEELNRRKLRAFEKRLRENYRHIRPNWFRRLFLRPKPGTWWLFYDVIILVLPEISKDHILIKDITSMDDWTAFVNRRIFMENSLQLQAPNLDTKLEKV